MLFTKTLFNYRDLNKQADQIASMAAEERDALLSKIEKEDRKITRFETILKNTGNFLGLIGTAAIAAATYLSAPILPLALGGAAIIGAIVAVSSGATIETQRNQAQTDTIRRILYKQKIEGHDVDKSKTPQPLAHSDKTQNTKRSLWQLFKDNFATSDIANDLKNTPPDDEEKANKALKDADLKDRKSTKTETYLKNAGYILAITGTVAFALASFSFAPFLPMTVLGAALYSIAFGAVSYGATLEAGRNNSQTIGLRRIQINNFDKEKTQKQKDLLLSVKNVNTPSWKGRVRESRRDQDMSTLAAVKV